MHPYRRLAASVVLATVFSLGAQTINLTGTVKDSASQTVISGARVRLAKMPVAVTTGASGAYVLTEQNKVLSGLSTAEPLAGPRIMHNRVMFGVAQNGENVRIALYTFTGKLAATLVNEKLSKGNYQVAPFLPSLAGQAYIVRLQIGAQTSTLKIVNACSGTAASEAMPASGASSREGLAKSAAAVNDTLIVSASGYATARKPITTYSGTFNVLLVASGNSEGSVLIENSSYQGCQIGMLVTVQDSDCSGATVPVRIKTTADAHGFTVQLKKVDGMAGTYADSVYFSIIKSDSVKRRIKVLDGDQIAAYYDEAAPRRTDSSTAGWSGTVANVNPGMSIYTGVRNKFIVNVFDPDVTDSFVTVVIASDKDKTGITAKLFKVEGSPGSYSGTIYFSLKPSAGDSVLSVMGTKDDNITILYHDLAPVQNVLGSICTWKPSLAMIMFDSSAYHGTTGKIAVTLIDDDIADSTVIVTVKSKKDPTGIKDTLKAPDKAVASFNGQIGFSATTSRPGFIAVQNNDSVTVTYQDDSPVQTIVQTASWNSN
jgi:hypothetical protein